MGRRAGHSPRSVLFNYDWMTLVVVLVIVVIGGLYFVTTRPDRKITGAHPPLTEAVTASPAPGSTSAGG